MSEALKLIYKAIIDKRPVYQSESSIDEVVIHIDPYKFSNSDVIRLSHGRQLIC